MPIDFPKTWPDLRVVLAHDWLTGMRGGERCLELLCEGFPTAPIYTLIHNSSAISSTISRHPVNYSFLQNVPGIFKYYRYFLPMFPKTIEAFKLPPTDLLISTSHCVAKGIKAQPGTKHLCYCFTPMRYAWTFYDEYFGANPLKRALIKPMLASLRRWDKKTSDRVDHFIAISEHVRARIKKFYDRDADVVYPPVNTDFYTPTEKSHGGYDLIVSALVPYKRIDLAVKTYNRLGYPLKIVGTGTETVKLRAVAAKNIEFLGWRSDEDVRELYRGCRLLVFPGEEDFGIVPLEAQASGRPVVALARGGVLETVIPEKTGVLFQHADEESLIEAIEKCAHKKWDASAIRQNALLFSQQNFIDGLHRSIRKCMAS